jgi:hypothetical protein
MVPRVSDLSDVPCTRSVASAHAVSEIRTGLHDDGQEMREIVCL